MLKYDTIFNCHIKISLQSLSGRLRLLTILEKEVFRTSAVSLSELLTSPSSINVIFALEGVLSERNKVTVLRASCYLSCFFRLSCRNIFFWFFLIVKHSNSTVSSTFFCFHLIFSLSKHFLALVCSLFS